MVMNHSPEREKHVVIVNDLHRLANISLLYFLLIINFVYVNIIIFRINYVDW